MNNKKRNTDKSHFTEFGKPKTKKYQFQTIPNKRKEKKRNTLRINQTHKSNRITPSKIKIASLMDDNVYVLIYLKLAVG